MQRLIILIASIVVLAGCATPPEPQQVEAAFPTGERVSPVAQPPTAQPEPTATAVPPAIEASPAPVSATVSLPIATAAPRDLAALSVSAVPVADGFASPTQLTAAGDGSGRLFVVEQTGTIRLLIDSAAQPQPFLDIRDIVGSQGNEQGLLSVAFHPQYAENGRFFVNYTDRSGSTVVAEYRVSADPNVADAGSARELLRIEQPAGNHNGGLLKFGPDGYLYIGTGDGGRAGDPWNNAQSLDTLLGKLLRIDVDDAAPYAVPPDNPFVGQDGARSEIWAYGLRNPWRFAFDRVTGDLYIADVGQNRYEEVHVQPAESSGGENYGWKIMEGASCFEGECEQSGLEQPVAVYSRDSGCSITGGYVYRGADFPQLRGIYFFTDFCSGILWAMQPAADGWEDMRIGELPGNISSFGEDEAGELYVTDRSSGTVYRLVAK
jgi:glucose/arabinose dehydrogenase